METGGMKQMKTRMRVSEAQHEKQRKKVSNQDELGRVFLVLLLYGILFLILAEFLQGRIADEGWILIIAGVLSSVPAGIYLIRRPRGEGPSGARRKVSVRILAVLFMYDLTLNLLAAQLEVPSEALMNLLGISAQTENAAGGDATAALLLYICLLAPLLEELIFRGVLLGSLKKYGMLPAIVVSAFFFGIMHHDFYQGLSAFLGGIIYGYAAYRYSFWAGVILHAANNTFTQPPLGSGEAGENGNLLYFLIFLICAAVSAAGAVRYLLRIRKEKRNGEKRADSGEICGNTAPVSEIWKNSGFWVMMIFDLFFLAMQSFHRI